MSGQQIEMTKPQSDAVNLRLREGWTVNRWSCEDDATVYLSKRGPHRGQTVYCQIDADGSVNS